MWWIWIRHIKKKFQKKDPPKKTSKNGKKKRQKNINFFWKFGKNFTKSRFQGLQIFTKSTVLLHKNSVSRENFTKSRFFTKSTVTKSGLCCSTSCNYQTGRYWQLWSNLPFLIPIPIGNWYSLCSVTASWPTPLEKVWNVSNYKREQRLKSLKIYEFWKSKNLEYLENQNILKILKIKISWKSMNFENLRSIRIMPKGIIMKNCERTTT